MARPVTFTFAKGIRTDDLEMRLGFLVIKQRAVGAADVELAAFLTRDVADEGLVVQDPPGGQPDGPEPDPLLLHVQRAAIDRGVVRRGGEGAEGRSAPLAGCLALRPTLFGGAS